MIDFKGWLVSSACGAVVLGSSCVEDPADSGDRVDAPEDAQRLEADPMVSCPGAYALDPPTPGPNGAFDSAGQPRDFVLHLPPDRYRGPRPILFAFHGTGGELVGSTPDEYFDVAALRDFVEAGFIVVAPSSGTNGTLWPLWDDVRTADNETGPNPDLTYFDDMLGCLAGHYEVDQNRVFVAGASAGASFANVVLRHRSSVLAGGTVASGVFELTDQGYEGDLDPMFVVVTWGGETDVSQPNPSFEVDWAEQAALASQYYDQQAAIEDATCHADPPVGHGWIRGLNPWLIEQFLAHPKGGAAGPANTGAVAEGVSCTSEAVVHQGDVEATCSDDAAPQCAATCQLVADCAVSNATVGPIVEDQTAQIGFTPEGDCGGCIEHCELHATTPADDDVLACLGTVQDEFACGPGIEGFMPLADGINRCCDERSDSPYCVEVCRVLLTNDLAPGFFGACVGLGEG